MIWLDRRKQVKAVALGIQGRAFALLYYLSETQEAHEPIRPQAALAREWKVDRRYIWQLLSQLVEVELVWRVKLPGKKARYYLNPKYWTIGRWEKENLLNTLTPYRTYIVTK